MRTIQLLSGKSVPILGLGTWGMGESKSHRQDEIKALQLGIDLGMTLIDTAEMYADGGAEEVVGEAISKQRDTVFLVTKVLPDHSSRRGTIEACERSLKRLNTDYIDLYLLHWRGSYPLEETFQAFQMLKDAGKILDFGVSNFDMEDMEEAAGVPCGSEIAANQVLYNLSRRGIEWDLLPWCQDRGVPVMAYSPIEQGRLIQHQALKAISAKYSVTPAQIALAWLLMQEGVISIPKSGHLTHIKENREALDLKLAEEDFEKLSHAFPPPQKKVPLEML